MKLTAIGMQRPDWPTSCQWRAELTWQAWVLFATFGSHQGQCNATCSMQLTDLLHDNNLMQNKTDCLNHATARLADDLLMVGETYRAGTGAVCKADPKLTSVSRRNPCRRQVGRTAAKLKVSSVFYQKELICGNKRCLPTHQCCYIRLQASRDCTVVQSDVAAGKPS